MQRIMNAVEKTSTRGFHSEQLHSLDLPGSDSAINQ